MLRLEDPPLIWATPSGGSLYKEGSFLFLPACPLTVKFTPSLALEPNPLGVWSILKII